MKLSLSFQTFIMIKQNSDHHWDASSGLAPPSTSAAFGPSRIVQKEGNANPFINLN